jgi:hypothetical protein
MLFGSYFLTLKLITVNQRLFLSVLEYLVTQTTTLLEKFKVSKVYLKLILKINKNSQKFWYSN